MAKHYYILLLDIGTAVVKIPLKRDNVDPDKLDMHGQTPLSLAARYGYGEWWTYFSNGTTSTLYRHGEVVKILLKQDDIDLDKQDEYRQIPLSYAAEGGPQEVVKILLERDDLSPNNPDKYSQTPLGWATSKGRQEVVKMLLRRANISPA